MVAITIALLSAVLPLVHLYVSKVPRTRLRVIHILLLYALVLGVGVIGLPMGFVPHVFFADATAWAIGWPTGSPFQFEVGVHDGAWGVLGFLCIWIGGRFWLATGLGWSLFMLGATYGHIRQTVLEGDYAPYNFLTIFSDGFIAVWLLALLWLYWRSADSSPSTARTRRGCHRGLDPRYTQAGGWQQARASPTGSGPEGSSPNERFAGCSSSLPPALKRYSASREPQPAPVRGKAFALKVPSVHG